MTKKDLFRLIIKIFGLYSAIMVIFSVLPSSFSLLLNEFFADEMYYTGVFLLVFITALVIALFLFLIYKSDLIIKWLNLDRGFDNDYIDFQNFNISNIIKLAVIVIGGILLINNIPAFLNHCFFAFKYSIGNNQMDSTVKYSSSFDYFNLGVSFLNIVIGYFMITNYNFISRIFREKNKTE